MELDRHVMTSKSISGPTVYRSRRSLARRTRGDRGDADAARASDCGAPTTPTRRADTGTLRPFGVLIELDQTPSRYFDFHHSADDTIERIDPAGLAQVTAAAATVVYVAAESPETLGRIPEEKRKTKEW